MGTKDIEKLKEKFEKDLNSKLFLPLAEEYRKEGMLDEAIEVLQTGLDKHKAYTSARVLLGKIYLEKGMLDEARKEFENVIASVPDNLFAHKKLAEIYRDTGEAELAIKAFKSILRLNPMDEESLNSLKDLESVAAPRLADQGQTAVADAGAELKMPEETADVLTYNEQISEEISVEAADVQVEQSEEDLNAFKESLFGNKGPADEEIEVETVQEEAVVEPVQDLTFEDVAEEVSQEDIPVAAVSAAEFEQGFSFDDVAEEVAPEEVSAEETTAAEVAEAAGIGDFMEGFAEIETAAPRPESAAEGLDAADRFVAEGNFSGAMGIYRKHLSSDPNNKVVLQRVDELRALLKLLGKDKEVLIAKLDAFLQGINKRRDEFFGRS